MRFKWLILVMAYLILLSSIAAAQNFVVENIHATVDGKRDLLDLHEDITVRQGSILQIRVRFENLYSEEDDIVVDVELEGTIDDIDAGHDIDEVEDIRVMPEDTESLTLEFQIPYITDDDDYWLELEVDAEADNGDVYEYFFEHKIEVIKPRNELAINNLKLSKDIIGCDSTVSVSFDILNTGHVNEVGLRYVIENSGIGVYLERRDLKITEGEIVPVIEKINVNNMPIGEHYLYVTAYCNNDETSVKRSIAIKKEACDGTQTSTPTATQTATQQTQTTTSPSSPIITQTNIQATQQIPSAQITGARVVQGRNLPGKTLALIINAAVIAISVVIYLIVRAKK